MDDFGEVSVREVPSFLSLNTVITFKGQGVEKEVCAASWFIFHGSCLGQAAAPAVSLSQQHQGARGSLSSSQRDCGGSAPAP